MRAWRHVAMAGLALSLALAAPVAGATGFVYTAQSRSVSVTIDESYSPFPPPSPPGPPTSQGDSESAPGYTTFWETARVASSPESFATQRSSLTFNSMDAYGTLEAASDLVHVTSPASGWLWTSSSLSNSFSTSFDVDEATPYRLTGSVSAGGDSIFGPTVFGQTTTRVTLKTAGGSVIAEGVVASSTKCPDGLFCDVEDPISMSSVGVLQPGSYVLEAVSTGSAYPFYTTGQIFTPTSSGSYFVTLEASDLIAVPALSPAGLACLAAVLVLGSLPTLSRLARVRD